MTSFYKQLWERERYNRNGISGEMFGSLLLTYEGLNYLDKDKNSVKRFSEKLTEPAFVAGMKSRQKFLKDPIIQRHELPYREDIHAMILLADDNTTIMSLKSKELLEVLDKFARVLTIEYGHSIRNENGDGLEHNGYVDGISQPLFLKDEQEAYKKFHSISDWKDAKFDPRANKDLVIIKDLLVDDEHAYGSYFVYRKLEQDVKGFKLAEENLKLGELGGAMLIGRFEDGTPVAISDEEKLIGSGNFNNFNYATLDPKGDKCPHFAHIRKTNPRISDPSITKVPIMARRGIPFGKREVDTVTDPTHHQLPSGGVGLLFMSYQASIINQFEKIHAGVFSDVPDPLLGINTKTEYQFPSTWGETSKTTLEFNQFVKMKGGEYFYAPSIPFFTTI